MRSEPLKIIYAAVQRFKTANSFIIMVVETARSRFEQFFCYEEAADCSNLPQERHASSQITEKQTLRIGF